MSKLTDALRRKYRSPAEALRALGLDARELGNLAMDSNKRSSSMSTKAIVLTRKAAMVLGALLPVVKPKLATDAKIDWGKFLAPVTAKNYKSKIPDIMTGIKTAVNGKLAKDASLDVVELQELLSGIEDEEPPEIGAPDAIETDPNSGAPMGAAKKLGMEMDADPQANLRGYLKEKGMSEDDIDGACKAAGGMAGDEDDDDEKKKAKDEPSEREEMAERIKAAGQKPKPSGDEPPEFKGMPKVNGDELVTKKATQVAIDEAITATKKASAATRDAERFVRPWIGDLAMAHDSADDVFRTALTALGVKIDGVHPSAFKAILEAQPQPGAKRSTQPEYALDAAATADLAKRFPGVARIKHA